MNARTHYWPQNYEFFLRIATLCPMFYNILSKNVRICNFARRKGTLVLTQIMGHLQKILKKKSHNSIHIHGDIRSISLWELLASDIESKESRIPSPIQISILGSVSYLMFLCH